MASSKQGLKIIIFIELSAVDFGLLSTSFQDDRSTKCTKDHEEQNEILKLKLCVLRVSSCPS